MKLAYAEFNNLFVIEEKRINSLIIENPDLFYKFINDLNKQTNKKDGKVIISFKDKPLDLSKKLELIIDVFNIDVNKKTIINKLIDELNTRAVSEEYYEKTMKMITLLQEYLNDLIWDMDEKVINEELLPKQLIKSFNVSIEERTSELKDILYTYINMCKNYLGREIFVFVNLRSVMYLQGFKLFANTLLEHEIISLFIENKEYSLLNNENSMIVDVDLCEI